MFAEGRKDYSILLIHTNFIYVGNKGDKMGGEEQHWLN